MPAKKYVTRRTPWWIWALRLLTAPIVLPFMAAMLVILSPFLLGKLICAIWGLED